MALIKCSECGKEISDMAYICPSCGCPFGDNILPLSKYFEDEKKKENNRSNWSKFAMLIFLGLALAFLGPFTQFTWLLQLGVGTILFSIYYIIIAYKI